MRTIKFRVWDEKQMHVVKGLTFLDHPDSNDKVGLEIANGRIGLLEPPKQLMQFTGLYDVNGKEIYEGDIIKHRYFSMKGVAEVYWNEQEACFLALEPNGARVILRPNSEIIGNIYENPELISHS
jgi:uncharacterized phage protein (TIGR01671 family)